MDIRSLLDSDASVPPSKPPITPLASRRESSRDRKSFQEDQGLPRDRASEYGHHREHRPPQPPPLRPPPQNEIRSPSTSSYNSVPSPYQKTPSSSLSLNAGHYPYPQPAIQSPALSAQTSQQHPYDGPSSAGSRPPLEYGQPGSLPQTPTSATPGGSYSSFQQQRPPSSHSASTPTSGHTHTPTFLRDSPQQTHMQIRGQYMPNSSQQYPSQPGTPLGPPTTFGRQGSSLRRESPGSYENRRTESGGGPGHQQQMLRSPNSTLRNPSIPLASPGVHTMSQAPHQNVILSQERERSLSVSPKTRLPSQLPLNPSENPNERSVSAKRKLGDPRVDEPAVPPEPSAKRSMSLGVGGMLNATQEESVKQTRDSRLHYNTYPPVSPQGQVYLPHSQQQPSQMKGAPSPSSATSQTAVPVSSNLLDSEQLVTQLPSAGGSINGNKFTNECRVASQGPPAGSPAPVEPISASNEASLSNDRSLQPTSRPEMLNAYANVPKSRVRYREVPIFARSIRPPGRPGPSSYGSSASVPISTLNSEKQPRPPPLVSAAPEANGNSTTNNNAVQSPLDPTGILGSWEPTITNVIPGEELTREIMNYLVGTIMRMNGVTYGPAGGTAGGGAMVEIEAKIGQIIDKNTNDRLRIPVSTECILNRNDPSLRTVFKSSMNEAQHRRLNGFLNQALKDSQPPPPGEPPRKPRVPLSYVHTRETDTFYDLSKDGIQALPPVVNAYSSAHNRPKVRITTDQKTGKELAKIVKVRVSDIEVYSPATLFDWRVSVSLEVNYDGDMRDLVEATEGKNQRRPDRNKDRVSYKHSHYQIDLTQVKSADAASKMEKEHELEIEISSAAVREQVQLVLQNQQNRYEELVKGFVDNVRILARHCKE
ncbi:MAG: hypothetical protein Q9174_003408 [Haloplaca sp. 1 TL-2023]